jgi:hypothetical protein
LDLASINACDEEAGFRQQFCGQMAHFTKAENGHFVERHLLSSFFSLQRSDFGQFAHL